jgi:hypothetical protein
VTVARLAEIGQRVVMVCHESAPLGNKDCAHAISVMPRCKTRDDVSVLADRDATGTVSLRRPQALALMPIPPILL